MTTKDLAVLILAAGASRRMGSIKQLLPWKGQSMLGHVIQRAEKLQSGSLVVVVGANADKIKAECRHYEADYIENNQWQSGLGSSIACGIKALITRSNAWEAVLILLCDQPLFDANYFQTMISTFQDQGKKIVATRYGQKAGVPAIFGRMYFEALCLLEKDQGAKNIIDLNKKDVFSIDSHYRNLDVDTIAEYTRLRKFEN